MIAASCHLFNVVRLALVANAVDSIEDDIGSDDGIDLLTRFSLIVDDVEGVRKARFILYDMIERTRSTK